MNFLRRVALAALYSLLTLTLFGFGLLLSLFIVFGSGDDIKQALAKSGIYSSIIEDALQEEQGKGETNSVPLSHVEVKAAIQKAFPPQKLEQDANKIIDGLYGWLQGNTPTPQFSVDLGSSKAVLAEELSSSAKRRLESLPQCAPGVIPPEVDAFEATCVPRGFSIPAAAEQVKRDILGSNAIEEPTLTADTIKNEQGETLVQQLGQAPEAYRKAKFAMYAGGVMILALSVGVIFLHTTRRAGFSRVGVAFLSVGVSGVLAAWLGVGAVQRVLEKATSQAEQLRALQDNLTEVVGYLSANFQQVWLTYSIAIGIVGLLVLLIVRFVIPKEPPLIGEPPTRGLPKPTAAK